LLLAEAAEGDYVFCMAACEVAISLRSMRVRLCQVRTASTWRRRRRRFRRLLDLPAAGLVVAAALAGIAWALPMRAPPGALPVMLGSW
jgi:hypothetical protein